MIRDTFILFKRQVKKSLRTPVWILIGLFQPILYLILFMPLLKNLGGSTPGLPQGEVVRVFVPGLLMMVILFGAGFAGFGVIDEKRRGFIERLLVTPISRVAILFSMILRDLLMLILQILILVSLALTMGLSISVPGFLVGIALYMFLGLMMTSFSYATAFTVKDEASLASITNFIFLPVLLMSGIMLPLSLAPHWLQTAAKFNPFAYVVDAQRLLFAGTIATRKVGEAFIIVFDLAILMIFWAVSKLRSLSA